MRWTEQERAAMRRTVAAAALRKPTLKESLIGLRDAAKCVIGVHDWTCDGEQAYCMRCGRAQKLLR